jgi:nickel/cobalt transporter (NicO) family protein
MPHHSSTKSVPIYALAISLLALSPLPPLAAQERIVLGAPASGSRGDMLARLGDALRDTIAPGRGMAGILLLAAGGLAYGILHSLGPGHQKSLIAGAVLAQGGSCRSVAAAAALASGGHAASVLVLGLIILAVERCLGSAGGGGAYAASGSLFVSRISAVLLAGLGIWMLIERARRAVGRFRGSEDVDCREEGCGCGAHGHDGPAHEVQGRIKADGRGLAAVLFGSLVPCPGALVFLTAGIAAGNALAGIASVLAISAGMFLTLFAVGAASLAARKASLLATAGKSRASKIALTALELGGSSLVLLFALSLAL